VSDGDVVTLPFGRLSIEKGMARDAALFFETTSMAFCIAGDIGAAGNERQVELVGKLAAKGLVVVGFRPESVMEMRELELDGEALPKLHEYVGKGNGIGAPRQADEDPLVSTDHGEALKSRRYFFRQHGHGKLDEGISDL